MKRELTSWRSLHLETSALRTPDLVTAVAGAQIGPRGEHLPATLRRLSTPPPDADTATREHAEDAPLRVAGWLDRLIGGVQTVGVDEDAARNALAIFAVDLRGTRYAARALSDGTLRILALALLESERDPSVICLEEPENGVHPERIPALIDLLEATAVDTHFAVDATNPLKQVILTTHAPAVVRAVPDESLLYAETVTRRYAKSGSKPLPCAGCGRPGGRPLPETPPQRSRGATSSRMRPSLPQRHPLSTMEHAVSVSTRICKRFDLPSRSRTRISGAPGGKP